MHTESVKSNIIPTLTEKQKKYVYAEEADVLNVALFGLTAKEWRIKNPELANKLLQNSVKIREDQSVDKIIKKWMELING